MLSRLLGAITLALVFLLLPALVMAADTTTVIVPVGSLTDQLVALLLPAIPAIAAAVIAWLWRQLPAAIVQRLKTQQAEQLLARAVTYGLNAVAGAARDKALSFDVGNEVVAKALAYTVEHGPGKLIAWLGGADGIREKILARIDLGPDAEVVGATIIPALPSPAEVPASYAPAT